MNLEVHLVSQKCSIKLNAKTIGNPAFTILCNLLPESSIMLEETEESNLKPLLKTESLLTLQGFRSSHLESHHQVNPRVFREV